jgi:hypothetical protein
MRSPGFALTLTALLAIGAVACGADTPREEPPPPQVEPPRPPEFRGSASAALPRGTCEPASGAMIGRTGLHGALFTVDPARQILVLYDEAGSLRFYRDQVVGPAGYTVRIDVENDSAWAMDRTTRARVSGTVTDFSTRIDLGPPVVIADSVRRRCAVTEESSPAQGPPRP